jgi:hypothetical protein
MKPCKYLDHDPAHFGHACDLITEREDHRLMGFSCEVKYWRRKPDQMPEGARREVQFCGLGRGRINEIFACYNPSEMGCHSANGRGDEE